MYFWRRDFFATLKEVAAEARKVPQWSDYADFCERYEQGLRREAFAILERFISYMERAPFRERRHFVSWLCHQSDQRERYHRLAPHPLQTRIVEPTLVEWIVEEPTCAEPHVWLGGYDHLKLAVELDLQNQQARRKLIITILRRVVFNTHELPVGYLGNPENDLGALQEADQLIIGLLDDDNRASLAADIGELRSLIEEYLRKRTL